MARKISPIINKVTLLDGGATSPTVELYQRQNGRCRLWWHAFDQDGMESHTLCSFRCGDWRKAVEKAREFMAPAPLAGSVSVREFLRTNSE
jgi:hypothetical protein